MRGNFEIEFDFKDHEFEVAYNASAKSGGWDIDAFRLRSPTK